MDFYQEFVASSWGKEFVAGGFGGIAAVISGHPLDTIRIKQQQRKSTSASASTILSHMFFREGPSSLYRGMGSPLVAVAFQVSFALIPILCCVFILLSFATPG